jgi:hypothetical protein
MGYLIALTVIFILALIGKSLLGLGLAAPFILATAFELERKETFLLAFWGGIIVALVNGSALGLESLALLLATGLVHLYRQKLSRKNLLFFLLFALLASLVYQLVADRTFSFPRLLTDTALLGLAYFAVRALADKYFSDKIMLKV